jgi:hypothetical protein
VSIILWFDWLWQNLASPTIIDSRSSDQAQFIPNDSNYARKHKRVDYPGGTHTGLCGLISVAAILNGAYPGRISANEVVDDFIAYNKYFGRRTNPPEPWPDYQNLTDLYGLFNNVYFGYLSAGTPSTGGMPEPVRTWLSQGSFAISGIRVGESTGRVFTGDAPHWLVITGISRQWNKSWAGV